MPQEPAITAAATTTPSIVTTTTVPISRALGTVTDGEGVTALGVVRTYEQFYPREGGIRQRLLDVRLLDMGERIVEDYQGEPQLVVVLTVSLGENRNGSPIIREFMIGRAEGEFWSEVIPHPDRSYKPFAGNIRYVAGREDIRALVLSALQEVIDNGSDHIGLEIPVQLTTAEFVDGCTPSSKNCHFLYEAEERLSYNLEVLADISSRLAPNPTPNTGVFGVAQRIHLFAPYSAALLEYLDGLED